MIPRENKILVLKFRFRNTKVKIFKKLSKNHYEIIEWEILEFKTKLNLCKKETRICDFDLFDSCANILFFILFLHMLSLNIFLISYRYLRILKPSCNFGYFVKYRLKSEKQTSGFRVIENVFLFSR